MSPGSAVAGTVSPVSGGGVFGDGAGALERQAESASPTRATHRQTFGRSLFTLELSKKQDRVFMMTITAWSRRVRPSWAGPGRVLALEGIDGAGTTTQSAHLARRLRERGHRVVQTREPSDGPLGGLIRQRLVCAGAEATDFALAALALLFAADRMEHTERLLRPAIERGDLVVSDRCLLSSLVYQGSEQPEAWVAEINAAAPLPHLIVLLDCAPEVALDRVERRGEALQRYEQLQVLAGLRERYLEIGRGLGADVPVLTVGAEGSVEEVALAVWEAVVASAVLPDPGR